MSTAEEREELLMQIRQALDTAPAIGDDMGMSAHLLEMALDEAARTNGEARQRERTRPWTQRKRPATFSAVGRAPAAAFFTYVPCVFEINEA
ncbi:hypothetical protein [Mesorhizobium sp. CAU 1732]|uniref:hypothetical protein n=1 Tax=Mesorhizobium sp. CAU 1732 TaxID=3140358 RepID=UPI003260401A